MPEGANYCGACVQEILEARRADEVRRAKGSNSYLVLIFPTMVGMAVTYPLWLFIFVNGDAGPNGHENWPLILSGLVAFHIVALLMLGRLTAMRRLPLLISFILSIFSGWITLFGVGAVGGLLMSVFS